MSPTPSSAPVSRAVSFYSLVFLIVAHIAVQQEGCGGADRTSPEKAACTALQRPAGQEQDVSVNTRLIWAKSSGAAGYRLRIGTTTGGSEVLTAQDVGNVTSFQPEAPLPFGQTIFVTVTPYLRPDDPATFTLGCPEISFRTEEEVIPDIPCPAVTAPADGSRGVPLDARLSWETVEETNSYRVLLLRMGGETPDTVLVEDTRALSLDLLFLLEPGHNYQAQVFPFNSGLQAFQPGCSAVSFATIAPSGPAPGCAGLRFPQNGATDVSPFQTLSWEAAERDAQGYYLQLNGGPAVRLESEVPLAEDIFRFYYPEEGLRANTAYEVRIVPYNEGGLARGCPTQTFTTGAAPLPGRPRHVRRNIAGLDPDDPDLLTYQYAFVIMDSLPPDHGHNWQQQADIHKCHCQHGSWFFLPWHRAYLYYFEEAIRGVSGNENFALPYWDWSQDPQIPDAFWRWPLKIDNRQVSAADPPRWEESTSASIIDEVKLKGNVFPLTIFGYNAEGIQNAAGALEYGAHNDVHSFIGGAMGFTISAALDPIFWTHHGNIDRLWAKWNAMGKGSIQNRDWEDHTFDNQFYDRSGNLLPAVRVSSVESTENLGYTYDMLSTPEALSALDNFPALEDWLIDDFLVLEQAYPEQQPARRPVEITLPDPPSEEFFEALEEVISGEADLTSTALLFIDGLAPESEDIRLGIFLGRNNLSFPFSTREPHYIGTINIFKKGSAPRDCPGQMHHDHGGHGAQGYNYIFDLRHTLRRVREVDPDAFTDGKITLQFVPWSNSAGTYQLGELTFFFITHIGG